MMCAYGMLHRALHSSAYVTPEELSAPDSYSGSPSSYSGAEITEELPTPRELSLIAIRGSKIPRSYGNLYTSPNSYPAPNSYSGVIFFPQGAIRGCRPEELLAPRGACTRPHGANIWNMHTPASQKRSYETEGEISVSVVPSTCPCYHQGTPQQPRPRPHANSTKKQLQTKADHLSHSPA
eukprot:scaffold7257_cov125-Isochrysis_galbana.AAC.2